MPRLVITGGSGFIGSAIVRAFLRAGWQVGVILRRNSDTWRLDPIPGWTALRAPSLTDAAGLDSVTDFAPDAFVHAAWSGVAGSRRDDAAQFSENLPSLLDSVSLAAASGCRHWIGLGSQAEYGRIDGKVDESSRPDPVTAYGKAKLAGSIAGPGLAVNLGMAASWIRIFSTYGPGDSSHWLIPSVIRDFLSHRSPDLTEGKQRWDYLFVEDCAEAILAVATSRAEGMFNVGSGVTVSIREVVEAIRDRIEGAPAPRFGALPYRGDQGMHLEADIARVTERTGWLPRVGLGDGLARTIEDLRKRLPCEHARIAAR